MLAQCVDLRGRIRAAALAEGHFELARQGADDVRQLAGVRARLFELADLGRRAVGEGGRHGAAQPALAVEQLLRQLGRLQRAIFFQDAHFPRLLPGLVRLRSG